jgi:hypothetical protein
VHTVESSPTWPSRADGMVAMAESYWRATLPPETAESASRSCFTWTRIPCRPTACLQEPWKMERLHSHTVIRA